MIYIRYIHFEECKQNMILRDKIRDFEDMSLLRQFTQRWRLETAQGHSWVLRVVLGEVGEPWRCRCLMCTVQTSSPSSHLLTSLLWVGLWNLDLSFVWNGNYSYYFSHKFVDGNEQGSVSVLAKALKCQSCWKERSREFDGQSSNSCSIWDSPWDFRPLVRLLLLVFRE